MDHNEEQNGEIEALDSIYCGDMEVIETTPLHKFKIPIKSEAFDSEVEMGDGLSCLLVFTYTPKYPEESPEIEIESEGNLENADIEKLKGHLLEQAKENLGMVMIFTLVSLGQEWLNEKWDTIKKEKEEAAIKKLKAEEEAEMKRFEGTKVTVETFLAWKAVFEQETGIASKREKNMKDANKLTGKEQFMRDTTLGASDLKFLDEGEAVQYDESLFQDMDYLSISDEDDSDYEPGGSDSGAD